MKAATQKQVKVINRYEFKDRNLVVYEVRSSNGVDKYRTTFLDGKATGCSCPAYKPCYHMVQLQVREDERKAREISTFAACRECNDVFGKEFLVDGRCRSCQPVVRLISREAYQDLFDPCTIPGMY